MTQANLVMYERDTAVHKNTRLRDIAPGMCIFLMDYAVRVI